MATAGLKPKMLITGVSGFVGKRLALYYMRYGYQVHGIDYILLPPDLDIDLEMLDITKRDDVLNYFASHDFEFVIHCAAIAHAETTVPRHSSMSLVNFEGSRNVFDGAASCKGLKRFVLFSSVAVYDESQPHIQTEETADCNPVGEYGHSKWLAEQEGLRRYTDKGFPVVVLRFCPIYGPERLLDIEKRIKGPGGLYFLVGSGRKRVSLCSILNAVEAVDVALKRDNVVGRVFNVADADAYTRKEILETYVKVLNRSVRTMRIPLFLFQMFVCMLGVFLPSQKRLYRSYFQKLAGEAVFDIRRILVEGYSGVESLEASIRKRR